MRIGTILHAEPKEEMKDFALVTKCSPATATTAIAHAKARVVYAAPISRISRRAPDMRAHGKRLEPACV